MAVWIVQGFAKGRQDKVDDTRKRLDDHEKLTSEAIKEVSAALVQGQLASARMEGQLTALHETLKGYTQGVSELKGRLDDTVAQQSAHIATISHMSRQIDALFTVVDGAKRASDEAKIALACKKS